MRIKDMCWMQVEDYLKRDNRAVLPIGSTEQHAQLSLSVDSILSERVAVEAAEPLGVPVFPAVSYGVTPYFMAFPGTVTLTDRHLHQGDRRHPGQPRRARASGASSSSTATAATRRPSPLGGVDGATIRMLG